MDLLAYLKRRVRSTYRQLRAGLDGLSEEDAARKSAAEWRRYEHGAGLDGSVAGIVRHVAAWKAVFAAVIAGEAASEPEAVLAGRDTWQSVLELLDTSQRAVERAAAALDADGLECEVELEGRKMAVRDLLTILVEHDQYHAGQVNLLRQQYGHTLKD